MKDLIRLTDLNAGEVYEIFRLADEISTGQYQGFLNGKSVILFFPSTSIRTRVTFEKSIYLLGGQPILFPSDALDKKEDTRDVCGYLNNWADMVIVRHKDIQLLDELAQYLHIPVVNAMTDSNHPCEVLSDMPYQKSGRILPKINICSVENQAILVWRGKRRLRLWDLICRNAVVLAMRWMVSMCTMIVRQQSRGRILFVQILFRWMC